MDNNFNYSEGIVAISRAATHAKKEYTAFEGVLEVLKMAQAAETEAKRFKITEAEHIQLKAEYADLEVQHRDKSAALETERDQKKADMSSDLESYTLELKGKSEEATIDHDEKMSQMEGEKLKLQAELDAMGSEITERTSTLKRLRAEARAHADRAERAARGR